MENMNIDETAKKFLCDDCIHAGCVGGFPDGDMFVCDCEGDPRVPFNMDENTNCPLYRKNDI